MSEVTPRDREEKLLAAIANRVQYRKRINELELELQKLADDNQQ